MNVFRCTRRRAAKLVLVSLVLSWSLGGSIAEATHDSTLHWNRGGGAAVLAVWDNNAAAVAWGNWDPNVYVRWNNNNPYVIWSVRGVSATRPAAANVYVREGSYPSATCGSAGAGQWAGCARILQLAADGHILSGEINLARDGRPRARSLRSVRQMPGARPHVLPGTPVGVGGSQQRGRPLNPGQLHELSKRQLAPAYRQ